MVPVEKKYMFFVTPDQMYFFYTDFTFFLNLTVERKKIGHNLNHSFSRLII